MMKHSPLAQRRGLTLTEALVAMFIAALGMIALLTLFPLGALQMAQALKDHRTTETATNAEAFMRTHWLTEVIEKQADAALTGSFATTHLGHSVPVFVDPIGYQGTASSIAGLPLLPRTRLSTTTGFQSAYRYCTLLDDMTFTESGIPLQNGSVIERTGRYNWLAVLQKPDIRVDAVANMTILVFDARSASYRPPNAEEVYLITPTAGSSTLTVSTTNPINAARGRWVAISTTGGTIYDRIGMGDVARPGPVKAFLAFYRVQSVDDSNISGGTITVELQTPVKFEHTQPIANFDAAATTPPIQPQTHLVFFNGLAEVFERPQLTAK